MKSRVVLIAAALALLVAVPALFADVTGSIRGNVKDSTGAALPGATVTVSEVGTNLTRTVTSGPDGGFVALALPPGTYNVKITKTGFKAYAQSNIVLRVNQDYTINATLAVGEVSQTVEVSSNPVQVQTTTTQSAATINSTEITALPLNGRNWVQLQQSIPGVATSSDRFGTYSTNGSRTQANDYLVNGTDWNDLPLNTPLTPPSPDALQEVRVISSTLLPEYGRNSGATLIADIKNGTNAWHGDAFEFYRDTSLNANTFFGNQSPNPVRAPFHQNQFGGTFGGPILHNKFFFFASYQGTRNRTGATTTTPIFTNAESQGNFSACTASTCGALAASKGSSPIPLFGDANSPCPAGGSVQCPAGTAYSSLFSSGVIPAADFNPISVKLLSQFVPQAPASATGDLYNYIFPTANTASADQILYRLDYNLSENDRLYYYQFWQTNPTTETLPFTGASLPGFGEIDSRHTQQYTLDETHTFTSNVLNVFKLNYDRFNFDAVEPQNPTAPSSVGFTGINPQNTKGEGLPEVAVSGFFTLGFSVNGPQPRIDDTGELIDHLSWVHGNHTMMFGADIRREHVFNPFNFENNGSFSFSGQGTYSTGAPGADFLLGIPDSYGQSSGNIINARSWEFYSFFQDQWQVTPKFNLVYGLGWQIDTPLTDLWNGGLAVNVFSPGQQSTVFPTAPTGLVFPGDNGLPPSIYKTHYGHFAPRLGIIYHPTQTLSIQAGYGIYYDNSEEELTLQNLIAPPFALIDSGIGDIGGSPAFANPWVDVTGSNSIPNKYPFIAPTRGANIASTCTSGGGLCWPFFEPFSLNSVDPKFTQQYVENANLAVEKQLPWSTLFTASYVGSFGHHLEGTIEMNPLSPSICLATPGCHATNEATITNTGTVADSTIFASAGQIGTFLNSNYNSMQLSLHKPFSNDLQLQLSYTWAHALDQGSSYENGNVLPGDLAYTYGDSAYDARHHLSLAYIYDLPKLGNAFWAAREVLNGWRLSGFTTMETGFPVSVSNRSARSLRCDPVFSFFGCVERPDLVLPVKTISQIRISPNHEVFNPKDFAQNALGTIGTTGRNFFHGPGLNNWDIALSRFFKLAEDKQLEIRGEFFNAFNHAQFANPSGTFGTGNFGRVTNTTGNPRLIQLAAKISF